MRAYRFQQRYLYTLGLCSDVVLSHLWILLGTSSDREAPQPFPRNYTRKENLATHCKGNNSREEE
jgi:hypothetical protein